MKSTLFKIFLVFFPLTIFLIALIYRAYGVWNNYPFWIDEFSTGKEALIWMENGLSGLFNPDIKYDHNNITTNLLVAFVFSIWGKYEWIARIPFVIIGALVPVTIYFLAKKLHNLSVAISASLLATFSYFEILWSRQARSYVLQQLLILLTTYLYLSLINKKNIHRKLLTMWAFLGVVFLGVITHKMYYIFLLSLIIHFFITHKTFFVKTLKNYKTYVLGGVILIILLTTNSFQALGVFFNSTLLGANNVWYYHSFLWRQYALLSFLTVIGLVLGLSNRNKSYFLLYSLYLVFHLIFVNFIFAHHMSKYLLPIFPFIFIISGYALHSFGKLVNQQSVLLKKIHFNTFFPIILTLFIIANGHKFVTKPKIYYSLNHDLREISNVDYHRIYGLIKKRIEHTNTEVAIIDTWPDRTYWYLGKTYQPLYLFRWQNENEVASGHEKKTNYWHNSLGEKMVASDLRYMGEANDLEQAMNVYAKGFIWIDDDSLPADVIKYAKENFREELYLDHYPLDDNPYSIWPGTLYSWGFEK